MISKEPTFWAYLAGLIDGEGSISVYQNGPRMSIANTHLPTLDWLKSELGGRVFKNVKHELTKVPCYQWECNANLMREIFPNILPYLRVKEATVKLTLEYLGAVYRKEFHEEVTKDMIAYRQDLIMKIKNTHIRRSRKEVNTNE